MFLCHEIQNAMHFILNASTMVFEHTEIYIRLIAYQAHQDDMSSKPLWLVVYPWNSVVHEGVYVSSPKRIHLHECTQWPEAMNCVWPMYYSVGRYLNTNSLHHLQMLHLVLKRSLEHRQAVLIFHLANQTMVFSAQDSTI